MVFLSSICIKNIFRKKFNKYKRLENDPTKVTELDTVILEIENLLTNKNSLV